MRLPELQVITPHLISLEHCLLRLTGLSAAHWPDLRSTSDTHDTEGAMLLRHSDDSPHPQ